MSGLSNYLADKLNDYVLKGTAYTAPDDVYAALFTTAPDDDGTGGTEVSGGSYARLTATYGDSSAGLASTSADLVWDKATADWGTIVAVGIYDASTSGNLLWSGNLTASKTIASGDKFEIDSGDLDVDLKPS